MKKTTKLIALLLVMVMLCSTLAVSLSSCNKKNDKKPGGGGSIIGGQSGKTESYSVSVKTTGGMPLEGLPIYVFEYEDGALGDLVEGVYASTNAKGEATFNLPSGSYAARISFPKGYDGKSYYPLLNNTPITVSSSVIQGQDSAGVKYNLGSIMYDFTVTTVDGETVKLSKILEEKEAVLLNFWYIDCSWCKTEFPHMQTVYEKYKDQMEIVALDPVSNDTNALIQNYRDQMGLSFPMAQDTVGLYNAFGVQNYPTSVVIDRYGMISLVIEGAIPNERTFDYIFQHYTSDSYQQMLVTTMDQIVPKQKPDVDTPASEDISASFDKGQVPGVVYRNDDADEYSWPFVPAKFGEGASAIDVIKPSNSYVESSYAQLIFNVKLEKGEALAFDYFADTERNVDIMYVIVDEKDIFQISGNSEKWSSCYAYVAEEAGEYEVAFIYLKDTSTDEGDDTVYLKDLRIVSESEIDEPTYIFRYAATNPDEFSNYQDFPTIVYNEDDGYWHVDSKNGPILLANLMGYTRFSPDNYVYNMCLGKDYEAALTKYCNYASNAALGGYCSVTEDLRLLLLKIADDYGSGQENEWLELCCYYDAYGTDKQLEDPIKGLAPFSAYDTVLSPKGSNEFPNQITYDRGIMPRGLFSKFTPTQSGTYLIVSYAPGASENEVYDCEGWIFTEEGFYAREPWLEYANVDKLNVSNPAGDTSNCYMMAYLEAGKDYYINIAYADVAMTGTVYFRVERLGGEGVYRLSHVSPGPFTAYENIAGELTETIIRSDINVELGSDGYWREVRTDGRKGSLIYVDFTGLSIIFNKPIYSTSNNVVDLIDAKAFNFSYSENDLYVINYLESVNGDVEKCKADLRAELGEAYNKTYIEYGYDDMPYEAEGYAVDEVLAGIYHGDGKDMTSIMLQYASKVIKAGDKISVVSDDGKSTTTVTVQAGSAMVGCVAVDAQLAEILQMLMDKYTFQGVKNSWMKLCYYEQYFCQATPK